MIQINLPIIMGNVYHFPKYWAYLQQNELCFILVHGHSDAGSVVILDILENLHYIKVVRCHTNY